MERNILEGKRILVVDSEPEMRDSVAAVLSASEVVTVGKLDEARPLICREFFDLVILDTVSANGCGLLDVCQAKKVPAAMLTAREVEVRRLNTAMKLGAMSFFPRDELSRLPETVADLLERLEKRKTYLSKLRRLGAAVWEALRVAWEETDQHPKFPWNYY